MLLAIDTAGADCAVLVEGSEGRRALISERIGRGHAERLVPMIGEALDRAGAAYGDLDLIAVASGPGTFTGIRIGVAAARGLSLALGIPALGIGVLDTLLPVGEEADRVRAAILPAPGETEVFALAVKGERPLVAPMAIPAAALAERLRGTNSPEILLSGAGAARVLPFLGTSARILERRDTADLVRLAALARSGQGASPPEPLYLKAPDAKPQRDAAVTRR